MLHSQHFLNLAGLGEWSLPTVLSLFRPQEAEVARRSQTDITCESGGAHCSTIMQSGADACES